MFGLVYALLLVAWLTVLNHKIQKGPEPVTLPLRSQPGGFLKAAGVRPEHEGSMSEAKTPP